MFAFGVYAANQVSVTTSGTVTFTATDVYASITRKVYKDILKENYELYKRRDCFK